ncbi:hypothetical protein JFT91_23380 [Pseudomonas sp. TH08]|nr:MULTISPECIES: hypothetical protein [unclassified Pseudomonas]MBK5530637.1 hypothetical protein [Pseudomonas sp. TH06]MBK5535481.1 hypothetical protein [Pseudomonas sp. TH08]
MSGDSQTVDGDETPEYPLPSPTNPLRRDELPLEEDEIDEAVEAPPKNE